MKNANCHTEVKHKLGEIDKHAFIDYLFDGFNSFE